MLKQLNPFKPGVDGTEAECEAMFRDLLGGRIFTDTACCPLEQLRVFRLVQWMSNMEMAA